jgi:Leucine-rich repeat (LRR) protein
MAASSDNPIKIAVGSTYSAGFDITARTSIDGRGVMKKLSDLTDRNAWQSKSGTDERPEYWLYNGLVTSVAETGKIYVLVGIDESQPATFWPSPAAPGTSSSGPRWVDVTGLQQDSFLRQANIVEAKYGYISIDQETAQYYESTDPNYNQVYTDRSLTEEVISKKYLKLVVDEKDSIGVNSKIIYCDIQDLVSNAGRSLRILVNGAQVVEYNGSYDRSVNFTSEDNVNIRSLEGSNTVNFNLVWNRITPKPGKFTLIHKLEGGVMEDNRVAQSWGQLTQYGEDYNQYSKTQDIPQTFTYAFGAQYDKTTGEVTSLGELECKSLRKNQAAFSEWLALCTPAAGIPDSTENRNNTETPISIYKDGLINVENIEHVLTRPKEYTIVLTAVYRSTLITLNIDGSPVTLDTNRTWSSYGYKAIFTKDSAVYPETASDYDVDVNQLISKSYEGRDLYTGCAQWITVTIDGESRDVNGDLPWKQICNSQVYSKNTYDPETEHIADITVSDRRPVYQEEVYTNIVPTQYMSYKWGEGLSSESIGHGWLLYADSEIVVNYTRNGQSVQDVYSDIKDNKSGIEIDAYPDSNTEVRISGVLTYIDDSDNTWYSNRPLNDLDVTSCAKLRTLYCSNSQLSKIDVSNNTELQSLNCGNNKLVELDLSNNTKLQQLICCGNKLVELDLSNNTKLQQLNCHNNKLVELDLSNNTELYELQCTYNNITQLNLINHTKLQYLYCYSNNLSELDLSNNIGLQTLYCYDNNLSKLDLSNNTKLNYLYCENNDLSELNVSNNTELQYLYGYSNNLTELDLTNNTELRSLCCWDNPLTSLNVSGLNQLNELVLDPGGAVSSNPITTLEYLNISGTKVSVDISKQANLKTFICSNTSLSSLDLSNNLGLETLHCDHTSISNLDLSNHTQLTTLKCNDTQLTSLNVGNCSLLKELVCNSNSQMETLNVSGLTNIESMNMNANTDRLREINALGSNKVVVDTIKLWFRENEITSPLGMLYVTDPDKYIIEYAEAAGWEVHETL